jgi:soluble lytic murein transglycosylase-like protein
MGFPRLSMSKVAFATALAVVFSFNSAPSTPLGTTAPAPSAAELEEMARLEEVARWLRAAPGGALSLQALRADDFTAAVDARPRDFGLFAGAADGTTILHRLPYGEQISAAARRHRVDALLLAAMVEAESSFDADVVSPRGAIGLLQVMPEMAAGFGVADPSDPQVNLDLGARYFSELLRRFAGDVELALAAYNAGPAAVERYGGVPPYRETNRFIARVLDRYAAHHLELHASVGTGRATVGHDSDSPSLATAPVF